jgi:hypothetical protein
MRESLEVFICGSVYEFGRSGVKAYLFHVFRPKNRKHMKNQTSCDD